MIKQVIVVRDNIGMSCGKIASQVAHASMSVVLQTAGVKHAKSTAVVIETTPPMMEWLRGRFTKIVVSGKDKQWDDLLQKLSNQTLIPFSIITDEGLTVFNGVPTQTCVAVGPGHMDDINKLTGHFKLL